MNKEMQQDYCKACMKNADFICEYHSKGEPCLACQDNCEVFENAGYRKQVWHKGIDGDLPNKEGEYYVLVKIGDFTVDNMILNFRDNKFIMYDYDRGEFITITMKEIFAWTELPEYWG